jgi:cholesterol oxidase
MRLSLPLANLQSHYPVIVIGSGYGGGVAAARLARAGLQICVFERGREFVAGEFPDTLAAATAEFQVDLADEHFGNATGLYNLHVDRDMNVLVGCGLGGTSLINAGVVLRAEPRVFDDARWPEILRREARDPQSNLSEGYRRAEAMLKPQPYPESYPPLAKLTAHQQSAAALQQPFKRPPINVCFNTGINHVGVQQNACINCGDCVSGCNHAAKNTTHLNYLPDAANHGAEIFTEIKVTRLARSADEKKWLIYFRPQGLQREAFDAPELFVSADTVVLAAGTLGSSEILLRSRSAELQFSGQLGRRFTDNGDVLAFAYNCDQAIHGIGFGAREIDKNKLVGPCITSVIDAREQPALDDGMVIEEGSLPGALAALLPGALRALADLTGLDTDAGSIDNLREAAREWESTFAGARAGAVDNTQTFLVMSHDNGNGVIALENDRLRLRWPGVGELPVFQRIAEQLKKATMALGGTYMPNPIWHKLLGHPLVTVHPLGGCCIGEDAAQGVVNERCQVFAGSNGEAVHEGLYVCDGAIVPRSLGVNPLFTITALAERACLLLKQEKKLPDNYTATSKPSVEQAAARAAQDNKKLGIQFTETMRGFFMLDATLDYAAAEQLGIAANNKLEFTLTMISDDLDTLLSSEAHAAHLVGTVVAPMLSAQPLTVLNGRFQLLVRDADSVGLRRMAYYLPLCAADGKKYFLYGYKKVQDQRGFDLWSDTTTLYISLHDGDANTRVLGRGILHIEAADFAKQMTTMRALNARNNLEALTAVARFGRFFAGVLAETYTKEVAPFELFDRAAKPRAQRPLRCGSGEVIPFVTADNVALRLTRYQGGGKGPVMLIHGLGVSSKIFSLDTIDTNLLEFLYEHGYDVWLLDFRASIELPAAQQRSNGDMVARYDIPTAVAQVQAITQCHSIQVVAHCFGATAFSMALLAGLNGVRSAVISQVATHYVGPLSTQLKTGLHLPSLLDALGVESLTAYRDNNAAWFERLYDQALRLYPQEFEERSNSAVDKRITFMYGQLWELAQLNTETHATLHETFGVANIEAFEHLAILMRRGHAVDAQGDEVYLQNSANMAIPIRFIHGEKNCTFLPESTAKTVDFLSAANGAHLYDRIVIPDYGHIDCIFGKNAANDVFPFIVEHLEKS